MFIGVTRFDFPYFSCKLQLLNQYSKTMSKFIQFILTILLVISQINLSIAQTEKSEPESVSDQVMVRMQNNQSPYELLREVPSDFELEVVKVLSKYSDIWLLGFNDENTDIQEIINSLKKINSVLYVQPNRAVEMRAAPNDPSFGNQWQYDNIKAEAAWDITTGGGTSGGTDIVVALIESADLMNHEDLVDNHWVNTAEIPNNGIDDDGNGYVDDYNGWNISSNDDNIGTGSHGTSCAGMIGAKGDNNTGVTGINWDIKIMDIAGYANPYITESNVVESYEYALQARLLWNQTEGNEGAFVVATSASFGIDGGDPNDYPIWCSYYDDLGAVGILNCGATTNQNQNVDVVGDVPSACSSDYIISVTATNQSDVIDFAGYGQSTIDLAAPGSNIYTTSANNGYGSTSGTSFATPLTAGLIGLMYSAPCNNIEEMAKIDPQNTADIVRQALFDGVDEIPNLATKTVTGGRINAEKSIDTLMASICNSCMPASNILTDSIGEDQVDILFNKTSDTSSYDIYIKEMGVQNWTYYSTSDTNYTFNNLVNCTDYEYIVLADCDNGNPDDFTPETFTTLGCGNCIDLNYCDNTAKNTESMFAVTFPASVEGEYDYTPTTNFGGDVENGYVYGELILVDDGSNNPEEGCNTLTNGSAINNNIAVIVRGSCNFTDKVMNAQNAGATAAIVINNVASAPIDMGGTNSNITIPAVMISQTEGNTLLSSINNSEHPRAILGKQNEWITSFEINGNVTTTDDNDGYIFTSAPMTLNKGETYSFIIEPGFDGQPLEEYYRIWLDQDQDGNFSQSEIIYDAGNTNNNSVTDDLTIPLTAATGETRMRVQMAYQGLSSSSLPGSCGDFLYGEVEDYCVTVDAPLGLNNNDKVRDITIYPNPSKNNIHIDKKNSQASKAILYNPNGQLMNTIQLQHSVTDVNVKEWAPGLYFVHIMNKEGSIVTVRKISILP